MLTHDLLLYSTYLLSISFLTIAAAMDKDPSLVEAGQQSLSTADIRNLMYSAQQGSAEAFSELKAIAAGGSMLAPVAVAAIKNCTDVRPITATILDPNNEVKVGAHVMGPNGQPILVDHFYPSPQAPALKFVIGRVEPQPRPVGPIRSLAEVDASSSSTTSTEADAEAQMEAMMEGGMGVDEQMDMEMETEAEEHAQLSAEATVDTESHAEASEQENTQQQQSTPAGPNAPAGQAEETVTSPTKDYLMELGRQIEQNIDREVEGALKMHLKKSNVLNQAVYA